MHRDRYDYQSVKAQLENEFQNQALDGYDWATKKLINEGSKDGDSTANLINRLFR